MRSLMDITDFTAAELDELMRTACDIIENRDEYSQQCRGKTLATLFYEPSTRTRLSFEAAMLELGGAVIGFSEASGASVSKGESVADTARIVDCYSDIIAMRHPLEGAPLVASVNATVPVINAGDGSHCHPTQTLADLLTIYRKRGGFCGLTVGFCGDLKYGRTVHSLISALSRYDGVKLVLISPDELRLPGYIRKDIIEKHNMPYTETSSLEDYLPSLDILYMTRIQQERFDDKAQYERLKYSYRLTAAKMTLARANMYVLHPLPRVNEISIDVDDDPRAVYFEQALNGKYMRMALILKLLASAVEDPVREVNKADIGVPMPGRHCINPKCIITREQELKPLFKTEGGVCRCAYCEQEAKQK